MSWYFIFSSQFDWWSQRISNYEYWYWCILCCPYVMRVMMILTTFCHKIKCLQIMIWSDRIVLKIVSQSHRFKVNQLTVRSKIYSTSHLHIKRYIIDISYIELYNLHVIRSRSITLVSHSQSLWYTHHFIYMKRDAEIAHVTVSWMSVICILY